MDTERENPAPNEVLEPDDSENQPGNGSSLTPMAELRALNEVAAALEKIPDAEVRKRVLQAAAAIFRVSLESGHVSAPPNPSSGRTGPISRPQPVGPSFSADRTLSPKEFILQKQPRTDVERVVCLAYYLTHYQDIKHFKTIDISKLNTDAAQPKFSNAAKAVDNATSAHYLVPASKGNKQLSAPGELFVQALPDRDAAKSAMAGVLFKKRKKALSNQVVSGSDENSGDE